MFLVAHLMLYVLIIVMLWFHVPRIPPINLWSLGAATMVLIFRRISWICLVYYRNRSLQPVNHVSINSINNHIFELKITLTRPWIPRPGQHVSITAPTLPDPFGWIQGHPYSVAWFEGWESESEKLENGTARNRKPEITIFVEARKGFSRALTNAPSNFQVLLNGPYGGLDDLTVYDKIQFVSESIGIAAHLNAIKILLKAHDKMTARVRRIDLIWYSGGEGGYNRLYMWAKR